MEYPLVTVSTLIYNTNPKYIIEAVESVRANNYPNLQHIIIDDGSPDPKPKEAVKQWIKENNYPCEFYEHEENQGLCKTLNHVLSLAQGEFLMGCCDDIMVPDRIITDVQTFQNLGDDYAMVFGLSQLMDSESKLYPKVIPNVMKRNADIYKHEDDIYTKRLIKRNCLAAPSITRRISILKKVGGYNEELKFEDYEMSLRLSFMGYKFKCIPKIQSYYRFHKENMSSKLNFKLESIYVLSQFPNEKDVKEALYRKVLRMCYYKQKGYNEALKIFENIYGKNWRLRLASSIKNIFFFRVKNEIFRLFHIDSTKEHSNR